MSDPNPDEIDVTGRPFLSDLFQRPETPPPAPAHGGYAGLYSAATGASAPQLHAVPPIPTTTHETQPPISIVPADPILQLPAKDVVPPQRPAAMPATPVAQQLLQADDLDWDLVDSHVQQLELGSEPDRTKADFDVAAASALPETAREREAWEQIQALTAAHVNREVSAHGDAYDWTEQRKANHVQAVFDAAFRYGRLSPLLRAELESFNVYGAQKVEVTRLDGTKTELPPIARTDAELERLIQRVAEDRGRSFAVPHGKLRIDIGGARFTAIGGPSILEHPEIAVRKHNLVDIDLASMLERGMLSPRMAALLNAAVMSHQSILVSGWAYTGKTTFLRALASAMPPDEKVVTIETERELYLHRLPDRHREVTPLQYMPDANTGDDRSAAFTLEEAIEYANRMNAQSFMFGEILGSREAAAAIKAMQGGKGTSSTIHAKSAYKAIQRFANLLTSAAGLSDDLVPQREIMESINLIVHLELIPATAGRPRKRVVREIAQVVEGDARPGRPAMPIARTLYRYDRESDSFTLGELPTEEMQEELLDGGLHHIFFTEPQA